MNKFRNYGKTAFRFAIATTVASLFAVPQVSADSMAGSAASSQADTQNSSTAETNSTTRSGGPQSSASSTQSTTQNTSQTGGPQETDSTSSATAVGQTLREKTIKETGVKVRNTSTVTNAPNKRVSMKTTVKSTKRPAAKRTAKWKTVNYNWKNGKQVR